MTSFTSCWEKYRFHLLAERHRRRDTVTEYRRVLYRWHAHLGERPWWKATPRHLAAFVDPARFSPATRAHMISIVRGFYAWAAAERLIGRDPMAGVHVPKQRPPVPRSLPLTDVRLIQVAADTDERDRVAVTLGYFTGLRAGEIARAKVEDVHLDDQPRIVIPEGKGGRPRVVPLHPAAAAILAGYLSRRVGTGPLLQNRRYPGQHLTPSSVSSLLGRLISALGIRGSAHSLRHSAATEMLRAGGGRNLEAVREFLGHIDGVTTRRYTSSYNYDVAGAVAAMPDPRNGPTSVTTEVTGLATLVPTHIADQLRAAVEILERLSPEVARAAETLGRTTTLAWLATLGLSSPDQLAGMRAGDLPDVSDEDWAEVEEQLSIRRGFDLMYSIRDSIDE